MRLNNISTRLANGNDCDSHERPKKPSDSSLREVGCVSVDLRFEALDPNRLEILVSSEECVPVLHDLCTLVFEHGVMIAEGFGGVVQHRSRFSFTIEGKRRQMDALKHDLRAAQIKWLNGRDLPNQSNGLFTQDNGFPLPNITSPVTLVFEMLPNLNDWSRMKIISTGEDRVGALHDLCERVLARDATFLEGFGGQIHEHGGFVLIVGSRQQDQLRLLQHDLETARGAKVEGPRIRSAETFDLQIIAADRVGLLHEVTGSFKTHNINMVTLASMRVEDKSPARASMQMRIDVPEERLGHLGAVLGHLVQLSDEDGFRIKRRTIASALGSDVEATSVNS